MSQGQKNVGDSRLVELARRVGEMSQSRQKTLVDKVVAEGLDPRLVPVVPRANAASSAPLSFAQSRLWFLHQLDPQDTSYNLGGAFLCAGKLDAEALEIALKRLVERHAIFRSRFVEHAGEPRQQAVAIEELSQSLLRLCEVPGYVQEGMPAAVRFAAQQRDLAFVLDEPPLLRASLSKLSAERSLLVLTLHHLVADAWSLALVVAQLGADYAQASQPSVRSHSEWRVKAERRLQFADFACWQQTWIQHTTAQRDLEARQSQLAGTHLKLTLPEPTKLACCEGERLAAFPLTRQISASTADRLRTLAARHSTTLYTVLLASFHVLLHRITGQNDLCVASSVANRPRPELEQVVGYFVNTMLLRVQFEQSHTVERLVSNLAAEGLQALEHQEAPLDQLLQSLRVADPEDAPEQTEPIDALFVLQSAPTGRLTLRDVQLTSLDISPRASRLALSLRVVEETAGHLRVSLEFDKRRVDPETAQRWLQRYGVLTQSLAYSSGSTPVLSLPWLPEAERAQPNAREIEAIDSEGSSPPLSIESAWRRWVRSRPERLAVTEVGRGWTYAELGQQVTERAAVWRTCGLRPGKRVLCALPGGLEFVASLLATLELGAVFVPCDPHWPRQRLEALQKDCGAEYWIDTPELESSSPLGELADGVGMTALRGGGAPALVDEELVLRPSEVHPEQLAYLLYTSGSTGEPKGVAVSHRNVVSYADSIDVVLSSYRLQRWCWLSGVAADLGYTSVWGALLGGHTLQCLGEVASESPGELGARLLEQPADVLKIAPSHLQALVQAQGSDGAELLPREALILGGETASPDLLAWISTMAPGLQVYNHYGPTEGTVGSVIHPATALELSAGQGLPIGRALPHVTVSVLDVHGQEASAVDAGQLALGGGGVAQGYWGRPSATAERFVPDPDAAQAGARRYLTGDRVVRKMAGLHFMGRLDAQLQLNGHRVEPGEVEAQLRHLPGVQDAAVFVSEEPGRARLVAVLRASANVMDEANLRFAAAERLPAHMVPSAWRRVETWPLLASGKTNRRALQGQLLELLTQGVSNGDAKPRLQYSTGNDEKGVLGTLAGLWRELLGRTTVEPADNFFSLGGDSILSLRLVAQARRAGLRLTPRQIFEHPKLEDLAQAVRPTLLGEGRGDPSARVEGEQVLTPIQRWFFELPLNNPNHFNQAALLAVASDFEPERARKALLDLVCHHDALRLRFEQGVGGTWQAQYAEPPASNGDFARLLLKTAATPSTTSRRQDIERECEELQRSLSLSEGRVFAATYIPPATASTGLRSPGETGPAQGRLCVVAHHLVVDSVSWQILLEDFEALCAGRELPPKTASYQAWGRQLQNWQSQPEIAVERAHWEACARTLSRLGEEGPGGGANERKNGSARSHRQVFSAEQTSRLSALGRDSEVGWDAVLWSGLIGPLTVWSGKPEFVADVEGHGRQPDAFPTREPLDLSRTVGWFTVRYPLCLRCPSSARGPGATAQAEVQDLQRQFDSVPSKGLGYGLLLERSRARPEFGYNFLGELDAGRAQQGASGQRVILAEQRVSESKGAGRDPDSPRTHRLSLNASIAGGQLAFDWLYSPGVDSLEEIQELSQTVEQGLMRLVSAERPAEDESLASAQEQLQAAAEAELMDELEGDF